MTIGWQVPGYTEERELGTGAQGRVVLARADTTGELVAIKYLARQLPGDTHARSLFRSEAGMLSRLTDPHVARLRHYVETAEGTAIIMEAVNGSSLRMLLDERGAMPPEAALSTLKGSLLGLASAHAVGVIHRDYKPANVVVQEDGHSKLIDFGVAVLTGQSSRHGTPAYMAPEQWMGQPSSPATDIYAATCVFFECVTGAKPYGGTSVQALMAQHVNASVPLKGLPAPLHPLVIEGMAKDPGQRMWDATQLVAHLEAIATTSYGPGWERQGLLALGGIVAAFAAVAPLGLLGSALLAPGASAGSATAASVGGAAATQTPAIIAQPAVQAGSEIGAKGALAKVGGAKGLVGIGGVAASAIVAGLLLWPSGPKIGGISTGEYRTFFTRPDIVLANATIPAGDTTASPSQSVKLSVTPARAKPGTKVRLVFSTRARTPWGLEYLGPGKFRCHEPNSERGDAYHQAYEFKFGAGRPAKGGGAAGRVWFHKIPPARADRPPNGQAISVRTTESESKTVKRYDTPTCSWTFDYTNTADFTIPRDKSVRPGKYLLAPYNPVGVAGVTATVNGRVTQVSPESVGARVEGELPVIAILNS